MEDKKTRDTINQLLAKRKRLLTYATTCSLIAASLTLTGCSGEKEPTKYAVSQEIQNEQDDMFTYDYEKDGTVTMKGSISYDNLSKLKMIRVSNVSTPNLETFYICKKDDGEYLDIERNKWIIDSGDYIDDYNIYSVNDFLLKHDKVKNSYTVEEYQEIKSEMVESIRKSKDMFTYDYEKDGTVTMKGSISFDNLSNLELVSLDNEKFYICKHNHHGWLDIEHNEWINADDYVSAFDDFDRYSINYFLLEHDKVKHFYSVEEVQKIKSEMIDVIKPKKRK